MLPIIVAGSRPAATVLVQRRHFDRDTSVDLHRLLHASITETPRSRVSLASTVLLNPIGSHRLPHAQQPNRHRARGTASRIHSRDFLPWRFSNAGPQPRSSRRRPSSAGIRKPSQHQTFVCRTNFREGPGMGLGAGADAELPWRYTQGDRSRQPITTNDGTSRIPFVARPLRPAVV
jgi:hypothetical protein